MKTQLAVTAALAGITLAIAGCSAAVTLGPGTAVPTASTTAPPTPGTSSPAATRSTGWELRPQGGGDRINAAGLQVLSAEGAAEHFHAHLDVFVNGKPIVVPADIGFSFAASGQPNGISALHSHDGSGIIYIEAPAAGATYTLGQFLTEWGVLDGSDTTAGSAHSNTNGWNAAVNGIRVEGKITDVPLKAHDEIVLFSGDAPNPLPAAFKFPSGL